MKEWTDEQCSIFLEKCKEEKIKFCQKYNIPIPDFSKEEDYAIFSLEHYGIDEVAVYCTQCPALESCVSHIVNLRKNSVKCSTHEKLKRRLQKVFFEPLYGVIVQEMRTYKPQNKIKECVGEMNVPCN